ncbi:kinase-like domain-containing protein [Trametes elegans]|nr:kinase-like domain-containing protein [Trametes elegans]
MVFNLRNLVTLVSKKLETAARTVEVLPSEKPTKMGLLVGGIEDIPATADVHVRLMFDESGDIVTRVEEHFAAIQSPPMTSNASTLVETQPLLLSATSPAAIEGSVASARDSDTTESDVGAVAIQTRALTTNDLRIIAPLGEGANGAVSLVADRETNLLYALKAMKKPDDPMARACIFQEQDVLKRLAKSPWFLALKASFEDEKHFFLLTDFYEGGDMKTRIHGSRRGKLSEEEARGYCAQIVLAMEELHRNRIIHRDLKPANLLLNYQDEVVIADFGLARAFGQTAQDQASLHIGTASSPSAIGGVTFGGPDQTAHRCGTPSYIAPEIWLGQAYSYGVDVWAFGVIMYEMLHDKLPFYLDEVRDSPEAIEEHFLRICGEDVEFDDDVAGSACELLNMILEKDPAMRASWTGIKEHAWFGGIDWARLSQRTPTEAPEVMEDIVSSGKYEANPFGKPYPTGEEPHPFFQWTSEEIEPRPPVVSTASTPESAFAPGSSTDSSWYTSISLGPTISRDAFPSPNINDAPAPDAQFRVVRPTYKSNLPIWSADYAPQPKVKRMPPYQSALSTLSLSTSSSPSSCPSLSSVGTTALSHSGADSTASAAPPIELKWLGRVKAWLGCLCIKTGRPSSP